MVYRTCFLTVHVFILFLGANVRKKYIKLNAKIEFTNRIIHFGLVRITVLGVVLPAFFVTIVNYFYYDLGSDSFYLPFPVMWVPFHCVILDFLGHATVISWHHSWFLILVYIFCNGKKVTIRLAYTVGIFNCFSFANGWIILYHLHGISHFMLCHRIILAFCGFYERYCKWIACFKCQNQIDKCKSNGRDETLLWYNQFVFGCKKVEWKMHTNPNWLQAHMHRLPRNIRKVLELWIFTHFQTHRWI